MHRQLKESKSLQAISVKCTIPLSSSSSLTRQQRPHPSQRLSHSAGLSSSSVLCFQKWSAVGANLELAPPASPAILRDTLVFAIALAVLELALGGGCGID